MSKEQYRLQLAEYGFDKDSYPRAFGSNCIQFIVMNFDDLWRSLMVSISECKSSFSSTNSYPWLRRKSHGFTPEVIRVEKIIHDLDSKEKPDHALNDLRNLMKISDQLGIVYMMSYSGNKGFHYYWLLDIHSYWFSFKDSSAVSLKEIIAALQGWLLGQCNLRTYDPSIISDTKRIIRLPFSPYFDKKGIWNGRFCVPLSREQVMTWNMERIIEYSKNPVWEVVKNNGTNLFEIEEMVKFLEVSKYKSPQKDKRTYEIKPMTEISDNIVSDILALIIDRKVTCVHEELRSTNPSHHARVFLMLFLMEIYCYRANDIEEVISIYKKFADEFNYVDFSEALTGYQVESIVGNEMYQNEPRATGCKKLQEKGICIGNSCPLFKE
jgi:hypothetical protein